MSLIAIALLNSLLGAFCGLWFRVLVLIPLVVIAFVEAAFVKESGMRLSPFRAAIALIVLLESGYLIGASIVPALNFNPPKTAARIYQAGLPQNVDYWRRRLAGAPQGLSSYFFSTLAPRRPLRRRRSREGSWGHTPTISPLPPSRGTFFLPPGGKIQGGPKTLFDANSDVILVTSAIP